MYRPTRSGSYGFTLWLYYSNESQDSSTSIRVCCFPFVNELEIKIAADTYLTQSQVVIVGISADSKNKGKIVVDINLLPLGEQVDSLTAELTYNKFWRKIFSLDEDLFGDYVVDSSTSIRVCCHFVNELEIKIAADTYLTQSQVVIVGVSADSENKGKIVVDINLLPLGEQVDSLTAELTYNKFWRKIFSLDEDLFGDYDVDSSTSIRVCCFPFVNELEIKIAADTYLTQSQVVIVGVSADSENKGKIVVDINLLPLGEQVDSLTAELTYNKFWRKRFSLDEDLFGDYDVDSSTSIRVCCFPFVNELEIKIAADTYLTQSQVVIVGVSADSENKGKIVIDINLLPLGEQVDCLTAELTYNKFWRKRFYLDEDLFGDYDVLGDVRKLWNDYYESLSEDYNLDCTSVERVQNMMISLESFGYREIQEECSIVVQNEDILARHSLNTGQKAAYDTIIRHVDDESSVDGLAGIGKHYCIKLCLPLLFRMVLLYLPLLRQELRQKT
ncbi:Concanavalin A-like lectin/glucanase, subgroup [Artemisia annua]|uniref:Concanavalin A-like lectin/glucanase, subgroup n=1 Tax=Artemisia annua TaxID=35608 RepID=A0A2U1QIQ5_ARTAN|nr:Concanavalin A-like lectin/glucanase, subgroup [Artemisia annua]